VLKQLLSITLCLFATGCAFTPQKANISPIVKTMTSSSGRGINIGLRVVDERPSKSLGHRGSAFGAAAEIRSAQEISLIVQREVISALRLRGFTVTEYSEAANPKLSVEVQLLEYTTSVGLFTGGVRIRGALKAFATNGSRNFEKMYRSEKEETVAVVPTAETNERWINEALSDMLNQLLNDNTLIALLESKSP
jgi:uncharacterized lipoprotein YajG